LGIAPRAKILPVRAGTIGLVTAIGPGVRWATDQGASVISISAGNEPSREKQEAIENAIAHDVVVVAAVGDGPDVPHVVYPAAYPGVLAVGGVDQGGSHARSSVTGPEVVLSAPAVNIASTNPDRKYGTSAGGTSDATAIVAGAAALVRAKFPNLSAVEVIHRLTATAIDKGPQGRDDQYGYGIVNLVGALTADVPPLRPSSSPTPSISAVAAPRGGASPLIWLFVALGVAVVVAVVVVAVRLRPARAGVR
jgi:subtilisin family serine protease